MSKPVVGFIGLGLMGSAMCNRLLDLDYSLNIVANKSRAAIDKAVERGAVEMQNGKALAEASDIIMLCMDTSKSVESRMLSTDGIVNGLSSGKVAIDFGTSLPQSTKKIGEAVAATGAAYLDAPLGRTPAHALDGLLNIMCAGDLDAFKKVEPTLKDLGENVFHLGALGSGHTIKLINNFFGMTTANSMAEAFAMADLAGIERQQVYDVMAAGPLHSMMMDFVKAYAVDGVSTALEFSVRNAHKDVGYYVEMVNALGAESLMSHGTKQALGLSNSAGRGDTMVSEQTDFFAKLMGSPKSVD